MSSLWIVHRDPRLRAALARLAAAPEDALRAAPGDPSLDSAPPAEVVLLGLAGDFEAELQFAHRLGPRLRDAGWVLVAERDRLDRVRELFDTLDPEVLGFSPEPRLLRQRILAARRAAPSPLPLSQRQVRDELRERFTRWFADRHLPESLRADLLRAVDPRLADVPLLVLGEPGTGRGLLVRYIHACGDPDAAELGQVSCTARTSRRQLLTAVAAAGSPRSRACGVVLEGVDELAPELQRELRAWIEFGPPPGAVRGRRLRWIGIAERDGPSSALDPGLARALAGLRLEIPPLRERRGAIAAFANDTARHWCARRSLAPRRMGEDALLVLDEYPWPGNLRELEATVEQTLAAGAGDPVRAGDLVLDGAPFAPLDAGEIGQEIPEPPAPDDELPPDDEDEYDSEDEDAYEDEEPPELERLEAPDEPPQAGAAEQARAQRGEAERSSVTPGAAERGPEEPPPQAGAAEQARAQRAGGERSSERSDDRLRRLAGALAHEVRNPLTAIRSFAALLPERYGDSEFRGRFAELVTEGALRIEDVIGRLERLASLAPPQVSHVDMELLLGELLRERRDAIRRRRLLVLKELETERPFALGDPEQLRFAFEALLNRALELVPERGDLYCASRHHDDALEGEPSLRVLLRFRGDAAPGTVPPMEGLSPAENTLEFVIAEAVIRAQGGRFALDVGEAETVAVIDLPAPGGR